eukprot:TRINITY_DN3317_c3_g1_i1.p1 TRINITY_DN3317_c3_g1~~TRINITY_DN3317_c3_g1_i1.p1  ORF type:complete len:211 (+),score=40.12 TRINITY_DN3317_c3_g1_i1:29-661(+)
MLRTILINKKNIFNLTKNIKINNNYNDYNKLINFNGNLFGRFYLNSFSSSITSYSSVDSSSENKVSNDSNERYIARYKIKSRRSIRAKVQRKSRYETPHEPHLKYKLQKLPTDLPPTGWSPPLGNTENLPFQFRRAGKHQTNLPVYIDYRHGRTKVVTIVRKYKGDTQEIIDEIKRLLGNHVEIKQFNGRLEVHGNYKDHLVLWLRRLGF